LKEAREERNKLKKLLLDGIDPSDYRKLNRKQSEENSKQSFEVVGREWFEKKKLSWVTNHSKKVLARLENDVFPWIGDMPISLVRPTDVLAVLRKLEGRGAIDTAHRTRSFCSQIFKYGIATGRLNADPARDLRDALSSVTRGHRAAITKPKEVGSLLRALDAYEGTFPVMCALKLAPLIFVRPGELRSAKWEDFDLNTREWSFVVTKTQTPLIVPLSHQSIKIIESLSPYTGRGKYLFPSPRGRDRPMSDNAVLSAMRRMDIPADQMTGHGFRAMARTLLDEVLGFRPDIIELQLAHTVRDPNGRAYNRTAHLEERKRMMQEWADYLDRLKSDKSNA
jgi:integrase